MGTGEGREEDRLSSLKAPIGFVTGQELVRKNGRRLAIREEKNLKLYRKGMNPVLRGLANIRGERSAHLWTRGWTPCIQTYPGCEVPNPLVIDISRGDADINVVLRDILSLTKLNYNTCIFGDGMPITLKFADAVGEILTAGPIKDVPPLPFGHYI